MRQLGSLASFRRASTFVAPTQPGARRAWWGLVGGAVAAGGGLLFALEQSAKADGMTLHAPELPWSHNGLFGQLDAASVRRGWEVYKQVCAACHSLKSIRYFHMINVCLTESEARAEAAEASIEDGPGEDGKMYMRPGRLGDFIPEPYPNDKAAALANNGAIPPELSQIVNARHGHEDYIFWLLMGYAEAPAGVKLAEGQAYNPYFPGGVIGMPRQLWNEGIEYTDGTVASASQQAKDVSTFLRWTSDKHHDARKQLAFKTAVVGVLYTLFQTYKGRATGRSYHAMSTAFRVTPGREPHANADTAIPSVFDAPLARVTKPSLSAPVSGAEIAAGTRHLYKTYAPRYVWKDSYPGAATLRELQWKHDWFGYKFGLYWNDQQNAEDFCLEDREAVNRLPPWEKDARDRRLLRAGYLSANHEWLPKEEWVRYEEENWYLQPYLDAIEKEKWDRTLANLGKNPNWFYKHLYNKRFGKGKAVME